MKTSNRNTLGRLRPAHLGVLKLEINDIDGAIEVLGKEIAYNDFLAETYYYLGLAYKKLNDQSACMKNMSKAKAFYLKGYRRMDPYTHPMDKVYLADIERELL